MKDEHFYTRALELDPKNSAEYYLGRADFYCKEHNYDKAYKDYYNAWKLGADIENSYRFISCKEYIDANEHIAETTEEIKKNPEDYTLYCKRGKFYFLKGQYSEAFQDATMAIQLKPCEYTFDYLDDMTKKIREHNVFDAVNKAEKSEEVNILKLRIKLAEENIILRNNAEYWSWRAEKDLDRIIELTKDKTLALYLKVNFYEKVNNTGNAIMYCKRVVEQSKKRKDNLGKVLTYLYEVKLATLYTVKNDLKSAMKVALNHPDKPNVPDIKKGLKYINDFAFIYVNVLKDQRLLNRG